MKLKMLVIFLGLLVGCTTTSSKQVDTTPEKEAYFSVASGRNTKVIIYYVEAEKFSPVLQTEFEKALTDFNGKCWIWVLPSYMRTLPADGPEYCVKFVKFTSNSPLKPAKRDPADRKMLLTALDSEDHIQVQNFVWDGAKLQRVRNSDSYLRERSLQDFMMLWALK